MTATVTAVTYARNKEAIPLLLIIVLISLLALSDSGDAR